MKTVNFCATMWCSTENENLRVLSRQTSHMSSASPAGSMGALFDAPPLNFHCLPAGGKNEGGIMKLIASVFILVVLMASLAGCGGTFNGVSEDSSRMWRGTKTVLGVE